MRIPPPVRNLFAAAALAGAASSANAQALSVTLSPTTYNGYHISCFGARDGAIDASVSGGTPPYSYSWTNSSTDEDLTNLASGYYGLVVTDALSETAQAELTLTEPTALRLGIDPFTYPSGHHISCNECFNGSIDITVTDGVPPYTYLWGDGGTTADRSGLGALTYGIIVTDANGCEVREGSIVLTQPERDDWSKQGNAGTNPTQHYFGSSDAKDVLFKSNGQERLRLLADGGVKLSGLGSGGILKGGGDGLIQVLPDVELEAMVQGIVNTPNFWDLGPFWKTNGNTLENQVQAEAFIGSVDNHPLRFRTNNTLRMNLTTNGDLGIMERLGVGYDGIENTLGNYPSRVNIKAHEGRWLRLTDTGEDHWQIGLGTGINQTEGLRFMHTEGNFPPTQGSPALVLFPDGGLQAGPNLLIDADGKVSIGEVTTNTSYGYRLFVEGGIITERVKVALKTSSEWSDHVFAPGYQLMSLHKVKEHIGTKGHLPGIPSAECMVEDGLDLARTDALLLEKIEELTLHTIDLNERLERAERVIAVLTQQLAASGK